MDNRLQPTPKLRSSLIRDQGLRYFFEGDNRDYLAEATLRLQPAEERALLAAGDRAWQDLREAARQTAYDTANLRRLGIPANAHSLIRYSLENEWDDMLIGRFDFAGGLEGVPLGLLEFNADTSSLLPETTLLLPALWDAAGLPAQQ